MSFQPLIELLATAGRPMIVTFFRSNGKNEGNHADLSSEPALVNSMQSGKNGEEKEAGPASS
eukprot:6788552-Ditylum_brightwellii.AAC.1